MMKERYLKFTRLTINGLVKPSFRPSFTKFSSYFKITILLLALSFSVLISPLLMAGVAESQPLVNHIAFQDTQGNVGGIVTDASGAPVGGTLSIDFSAEVAYQVRIDANRDGDLTDSEDVVFTELLSTFGTNLIFGTVAMVLAYP